MNENRLIARMQTLYLCKNGNMNRQELEKAIREYLAILSEGMTKPDPASEWAKFYPLDKYLLVEETPNEGIRYNFTENFPPQYIRESDLRDKIDKYLADNYSINFSYTQTSFEAPNQTDPQTH